MKTIRWWPAAVVVLLWLVAVVWVAVTGERTGQEVTMARMGVSLIAGFLLLLWFLLLSKLPWKVRLGGFAAALLLAIVGSFFVEIRGVTGDLVPVLGWKGSRDTPTTAAALPAPEVPADSGTSDSGAPGVPGDSGEVPAASEGVPAKVPGDSGAPDLSAATEVPADSGKPKVPGDSGTGLPGAADYPQFLGPQRDGRLPGARLARDWSARPPREVWRQPVGAGWAGFAVAGGVAYTMEQSGEDELVTAYELATGNPRWRHTDRARYESTIGGLGPRSVPTVAGGRVFAHGATGRLRALDATTGQLLWQRDVTSENGAQNPEWGRSNSPLVVDGLVILNPGGPEGRLLAAYDAATGAPRWVAGEGGPSFSSPIVAEFAGVRQVISFNSASLSGHSLDDGRVLWQYPWPREQPNVSVPLALGPDLLFASSGYGIGGKLLHLAVGPDGVWTPTLRWETPRLKAKFTNVVFHGGFLYGLDDGTLVCLDPATGERRWREGRYGHGQVILAGELLLVQTEEGELVLVDPRPDAPKVLGTHRLFDGKTWNPPALAGRYLLARTDQEAVLLELPGED